MTSSERRPIASRLAIRFAIILALALLPAGVIAFIKTDALENEIEARNEAALLGATVQAAMAETGLIRRVRGMVASLSHVASEVIDDPAACSELMRGVANEEPTASLVAFIPVSGLMTCSSVGRTYAFSGNPFFEKVVRLREPGFVVNPRGPVSGTSVLGISHPVLSAAGDFLGYVVVSLPHNALNDLRLDAFGDTLGTTSAPIEFWTFDRDGTLLTSNLDLAAAAERIPASHPLTEFVGTGSSVLPEISRDGRDMTYAVVPIVPGDLYLMSAFRREVTDVGGGLSAYMPSLLMWLIGLVAAGLAAEFLVTRHVRTLNRAIVSFARGDRRLQAIDLDNAPVELHELASAYTSMTESITRSEAELEDSVHQKEVLLREVHHRVKNNLQLISSIMNIQLRSAESAEAKTLLRNLQERIMSLATVHRGLYQTSGLADVRARELIPDILRQITSISSGPERPFVTETDIDDLRLVPDQAIPLSLLLAEALTNAMKHAGATRDRPGKLRVRLKRSGGSEAVLQVSNSRPDVTMRAHIPASSTGIGTQLIMAFVQQLGGRIDSGEDDTEYHMRVTFPVSPLVTAENRERSEALSD
ncbi:sensor histidine kinase [Tabrizicola sp. BL-A-41-H6]|uniref:sensor histidine kinase n=1 Tax=Tabrizicola sp. BL-A-41-H6 TaxID=3421107 RepID=UPI003D66A646